MAWRRAIVPAPALVGGGRRRQSLKQVSDKPQVASGHERVFCPLRAKFHSQVSMSVCATTINLPRFANRYCCLRHRGGEEVVETEEGESIAIRANSQDRGQEALGWVRRKDKGNCPWSHKSKTKRREKRTSLAGIHIHPPPHSKFTFTHSPINPSNRKE